MSFARLPIGPSAVAPKMPPVVDRVLTAPGRPLDPATRSSMGTRFGHDFSRVRVHTDSQAAASAQAMHAAAYTVGTNVVFDTGYAPRTRAGRELLAHELTHVVQQSRASALDGFEPAADLEHAAERNARTVADGGGGKPELAATGTVPALMRQPGHAAPPKVVAPVPPTRAQQTLIDDARKAAAVRAQLALIRLRGITPAGPPKAVDPGVQARTEAYRLAQVMFDWTDPNMDQIEKIVGSMVSFLTSSLDIKVAGAHDPDCGSRAAYVRGLKIPVVVCPAFFSGSAEERVRTLIHESAHLSRIGTSDLSESYCVVLDCKSSCGGFESADSWAHYVHCLSGRKPDPAATSVTAGPKGPSKKP